MFKKVICFLGLVCPVSTDAMRFYTVMGGAPTHRSLLLIPLSENLRSDENIPLHGDIEAIDENIHLHRDIEAIEMSIDGFFYADEHHNIFFCFEDDLGNVVSIDVSHKFNNQDVEEYHEEDFDEELEEYFDEESANIAYPWIFPEHHHENHPSSHVGIHEMGFINAIDGDEKSEEPDEKLQTTSASSPLDLR